MKKLGDIINLIFVLFIVCAVIFGALEEGYIVQVFIIFGILGIIIFLDLNKKKADEKNKIIEKEKRSREDFKLEIDKIKHEMYLFAYRNNKISRVTYDIEEGGDYLSEFSKYGIGTVDRIVDDKIRYPDSNLKRHIPEIQKELLRLEDLKVKEHYIGF